MDVLWERIGLVAAVVFCGLLLVPFLAQGFRRLKSIPKGLLVPLLACAVVAVVEADKTNSPPRLLLRQLVGGGGAVSAEEIARGYRLDSVTNDAAHDYAMPTNATCLGNVHVHGASSSFGRNVLDFGEWAFPLGTNDAVQSRFWWLLDGRIRLAPHNAAHEIAVGAADVLAVPGESRVWWAVGAADTRIVEWEHVYPNRDTNEVANLQVVLKPNGGFETWSNDVGRLYARIDPHDWDGDGLDNAIDLNPQSWDGDAYGTGGDWLNANCGGVLSASLDTNGEVVIAWHDGVCTNAYYWLEFAPTQDGTRTTITCDGPSDLGDLAVIAHANQTCRVPLLTGARYQVQASRPVAGVSASDPLAEITFTRSVGAFFVERPVSFSLVGDGAGGGTMSTDPYVGAEVASVTGNCCHVGVDGASYAWTCNGCGCSGFGQWWRVTAAWEGYSKAFDWRMQCDCQRYNETHPETWIGLSCPRVVMRNGNAHFVSADFDPPCETNATFELTCVAGADKLSILASGDGWMEVQGAVASDEPDDVAFRLVADIDGVAYTNTASLTVACVDSLLMSSPVAGVSANPPPFDGETACPFSITNSLSPDRHLVVPFCNVATLGTNGFAVADFTVDMGLALAPTGVDASSLPCEWELVEAIPQMSGSLVPVGGLAAQFRRPTQGGVYRFRARCDGSPWTEGTVVLPLSGAGVDGTLAADFAAVDATIAFVTNRYGYLERQTISFGEEWFYLGGVGDYLGRVDAAAKPTVWPYNQVNDVSGMGAVATLCGVPTRMAKLSNFLVAYETERIGIWRISRWLARINYGTGDDAAAAVSWNAGTALADGADFAATVSAMATNMWPVAAEKERRLWPNSAPADNHADYSFEIDFNHNFISPGFTSKRE